MKSYRYKIRDKAGKLKEGIVRAESLEHAHRHFKEIGVMAISVVEQRSGSFLEVVRNIGVTIRVQEIMIFTRQMYALCLSGLPLVNGLKSLETSTKNKHFRALLQDIKRDIEGGASFSAALEKHPKQFNSIYCSIIQAGEASGSLPEVLQRLSEVLEKDEETKSKIKQALSYPVIVICVIIIALLAVGFFVLPRFQSIFRTFGEAELPVFTQILMSSNHILRTYWYIGLVAVVLFVFGFRQFHKSTIGKPIVDWMLLRIPVFGNLMLKITIGRFAGTVASLAKSGVPIVETLNLASRTTTNYHLVQSLSSIQERVREGKSMGAAMADEPLFPDMIVQMVCAGEESGRIDELLQLVADFYDRETSITIKNLTTLLEPILLVFIAGIVIVLALGIFLPLWNLSNSA